MRILYTLTFLLFCLSVSAVPGPNSTTDSLKKLLFVTAKDIAQPDTAIVNNLNKLADSYFNTRPDSTLYFSEKSSTLARKINYQSGLAKALLLTGHVNFFKGNATDAVKNFDEAIGIYQKLKDQSGLNAAYVLYGRMFGMLGKFPLALLYFNKAIEIGKKINDNRSLTDCYKGIGNLYYGGGQFAKALDYYHEGLFIALQNHYDIFAAQIYNDIGVVLQGMGAYPNALSYFGKAAVIFEKYNDSQDVEAITQNKAEVFIAQAKYDEAIAYLNKALVLAKKADDKDGLSLVYTDLGMSYAHKNQYRLATSYLDTSLHIATQYKITYNQAYALIGFATVRNYQKDYAKAYNYAIQAKAFADELDNAGFKADATLQLSKAADGLGKVAEAYRLLKNYNTIEAGLKNNEIIQKLTSYNLELVFSAKERQLKQQQHEQDLIYQQRTRNHQYLDVIFIIIIMGMVMVLSVYYKQKSKQLTINTLLEAKNHEVVLQKISLDDQARRLNESNKLKDRLISILAHDLRAPLSTLRGLFDLLIDDTISHSELLQMLPDVLKKLEHTSDFLDTLLFWINSQMDTFIKAVRSFNLKEIATYELENYQEQAALKGIRLYIAIPDNLIATADPNSIRIVLRNLVTNALKFSKANDTIKVSASLDDEQHIVIKVKDTGMGMSADQQTKLFKSKVDSSIGTNNESGTGMGLLFCKDLVEKCNGTIWVSSQQGVGTEFAFTVPTAYSLYNV